MTKQNKSMIGHDPLAWLKSDADESMQEIQAEDNVGVKKQVSSKKKNTTQETRGEQTTNTDINKEKKIKQDSEEIDRSLSVTIQLQAIQDISIAAQQYREWKEVLTDQCLIIDGSQVECIDAASMQLIYALISEAEIRNSEIIWNAPSDVLRDTAKLLDMEKALHLDERAAC